MQFFIPFFMKTHIFYIIGLLFLISCQTTPKNSWQLVWEEDFNQGIIDTNVWSKIPRGKVDWNNYMSYEPACFAVENSNLILTGMPNTTQPGDTAPFLTGGVYTKGKLAFSNGRIEIKAKFDCAHGVWPALWMLPEKGQWPTGGEIDIMEHLNFDTIAYQTVHSHYTYDLGIEDNPPHGHTAPIQRDNYNIYSVDLYPDSLVFAINHTPTFTYPRIQTDKEGQFPFNQPFYILLDMQIGGKWVGTINPEQLPARMYIDWVRFYQKK